MTVREERVELEIGGVVVIAVENYEPGSIEKSVSDSQDTAAEVLEDFDI